MPRNAEQLLRARDHDRPALEDFEIHRHDVSALDERHLLDWWEDYTAKTAAGELLLDRGALASPSTGTSTGILRSGIISVLGGRDR
jgi:hypothetical protein